jgi:hypothetical protein
MERAERDQGWLAWCNERSIFVALSEEFVSALSAAIKHAKPSGPVLEIAAGDGALAQALSQAGVNVIATDRESVSALKRFTPDVVLACFPPIDCGIERTVLAHPGVKSFFYIGPLINERPGPETLWADPAWSGEPLTKVDQYLISRLDFLTDFTRATHLRRAGAVCLTRLTQP